MEVVESRGWEWDVGCGIVVVDTGMERRQVDKRRRLGVVRLN